MVIPIKNVFNIHLIWPTWERKTRFVFIFNHTFYIHACRNESGNFCFFTAKFLLNLCLLSTCKSFSWWQNGNGMVCWCSYVQKIQSFKEIIICLVLVVILWLRKQSNTRAIFTYFFKFISAYFNFKLSPLKALILGWNG